VCFARNFQFQPLAPRPSGKILSLLMNTNFEKKELQKILDQAVIYRCACPAQLAELMLSARKVYDYEQRCLNETENNLPETHHAISRAVEQSHAIYEDCLEHILEIEGWDRETLEMPEGLREKARAD